MQINRMCHFGTERGLPMHNTSSLAMKGEHNRSKKMKGKFLNNYCTNSLARESQSSE